MSQDLVAQALAALRHKDFATARDRIASYAEDRDLEIQHYLIKGLSELALRDWAAAEETFAEATDIFPYQAQLWFNRGVAAENLGAVDDAELSYEKCLDLQPNYAEACGNLSNIYRRQGYFIDAEEMAHRAYEEGAPKAQALNALGLAIARQGKFDAAEKVFNEAKMLEPSNADILTNLANLAVDQLKFAEAWPLYAAARVAGGNHPATRRDEAMARMLAGDFTRGWPLYEARLELPTALRIHPACPRWAGENLVGKKLLIVAEQGFGDAIQFCRYGKALADRGAELIWVVRPPLQRLFAANLPGQIVVEDAPLPAADCWIPIVSLPLALMKFEPGDAPPAPYLVAPSEPKILSGAGGKKRIGLVWSGSPNHERDHERSIPLREFAPLWQKIPALFYAPFTGHGLEQISSQTPVVPLDRMITNFLDTAALLAQLDCLVTVDTAVAHLAGALGVTTYLLLPFCPDWRWGVAGAITPWYPHMTLVRQPRYGDWTSVIEPLADTLSIQ